VDYLLYSLTILNIGMAFYNAFMMQKIEKKKTALTAQEEYVTELLLRIRLGANKRRKI
jgi:hypothetical protein